MLTSIFGSGCDLVQVKCWSWRSTMMMEVAVEKEGSDTTCPYRILVFVLGRAAQLQLVYGSVYKIPGMLSESHVFSPGATVIFKHCGWLRTTNHGEHKCSDYWVRINITILFNAMQSLCWLATPSTAPAWIVSISADVGMTDVVCQGPKFFQEPGSWCSNQVLGRICLMILEVLTAFKRASNQAIVTGCSGKWNGLTKVHSQLLN
jgi:hypothetical protein